MPLILASSSPRRQALLTQIGREFQVIVPLADEILDEARAPEVAVTALALQKAREVAAQVSADDTVLAADTMVYHKGTPLGKPRDANEAFAMLKRLSNGEHEVYTAVAVIHGQDVRTDCVKTKVHFRKLYDAEIQSYIATGDPLDKAGAYGIQGMAAQFVQGIQGDFYNVVGLPLCRVTEMLKEMGV